MADGLRRLDGVADVEVDLQANVCEVTPMPDRLPDLAGLPAAVAAAGYRPGRVWLQARGSVREDGDGGGGTRRFVFANSVLALPLHGDVGPDGSIAACVTFAEEPHLIVGPPPPAMR